HAAAIVDAHRLAARAGAARTAARRFSALLLALLLVATFTLHAAIEVIGYQAYDMLDTVFVPADDGWAVPEPSFGPVPTASPPPTVPPTAPPSPPLSPSASASPSPSATPSPTPGAPSPSPAPRWAEDGRLNVVLIGSDAGPDRRSLRTDTIIVLSVDVESGHAALFGVPRNLVGVPLPPESAKAFKTGRFPGLLNALYVYAMGHPGSFPGGESRGFRAVTGAVQELVGVGLDGVVVVSLAGFVQLVDELGGLWIDIPARLVDRNYPLEDGSGYLKLDFRPGCQELDGRMALAYARSRHQDSDYGRMRRQQTVLISLARQLDPIALVPKVPRLLKIAKDSLWTTIKRGDVRQLAELADRVNTSRVKTILFTPSRYPSHLDTAEIAKIQRVVRTVFDGEWKTSASSWARPGTCP
ncbi:MAG TPA: LCP family protein, partial [Candidatus Limnocylindrales bacterium]|nr:LCP family protein [Candidatus Limnocylindrales bacterium]